MSATHRFTEPSPTYRGWDISFENPPIPFRGWGWQATHPDYEPGHPGHISAESRSAVMNEIDLYIEEHGEDL